MLTLLNTLGPGFFLQSQTKIRKKKSCREEMLSWLIVNLSRFRASKGRGVQVTKYLTESRCSVGLSRFRVTKGRGAQVARAETNNFFCLHFTHVFFCPPDLTTNVNVNGRKFRIFLLRCKRSLIQVHYYPRVAGSMEGTNWSFNGSKF